MRRKLRLHKEHRASLLDQNVAERCADDALRQKGAEKIPMRKRILFPKADRQAEKRKMRCVGRKVIGKDAEHHALRVGPSAEKHPVFRAYALQIRFRLRALRKIQKAEKGGALFPEPHTVRKSGLEQLLLFSVHQKKTPFCSSSSITSSPLRSTLYGVMINVPVETRLILPSFA